MSFESVSTVCATEKVSLWVDQYNGKRYKEHSMYSCLCYQVATVRDNASQLFTCKLEKTTFFLVIYELFFQQTGRRLEWCTGTQGLGDLRDQRLYRERKMAFACLVRFTCLLCGTFVLFLYTIVCVEMTDREKYNKHFTLCWFTIKCAALYIFLLQQPPS